MQVRLSIKSLNEGVRRSRTYYNDTDELVESHFYNILGRHSAGLLDSKSRIELDFQPGKVVLRPRFIPSVEVDGTSILPDEPIVIHPKQDYILNLAGDEFLVTAHEYEQ